MGCGACGKKRKAFAKKVEGRFTRKETGEVKTNTRAERIKARNKRIAARNARIALRNAKSASAKSIQAKIEKGEKGKNS